MIGTIQQANKSKSGQTLSVQINNKWYTTKNWELETSIGKSVVFEPSISPASGNFPEMHWLNDYVFEGQGTGPAAEVMNRAMADAQAPPDVVAEQRRASALPTAGLIQAQTAMKDRDASICAQALTKACTGHGDEVGVVFRRYMSFYEKYMAWDPNNPY